MARSKQPRQRVAYVLRRDERGWRAEAHSEQDPVLSPVGIGGKQEEAVANLISQPQFQRFLERTGASMPEFGDFAVDAAAEREMIATAKRQYGDIAAGPQRAMQEPSRLEPRNIKPRRPKPAGEAQAAKLPPEASRVKPPVRPRRKPGAGGQKG